MKAIALISGGLDSRLAAKLVLQQGINLLGVHFTSLFSCSHDDEGETAEARAAAKQLGIPLTIQDITEDLTRLVNDPPHGHGSGMNPCIDCRILQLGRAKRMMEENNARFIVSGEVVGQRPMSQRRGAMNVIEKEAGVEGLLLRPLSAHSLEPTIAENRGWVDRDLLRDFSGRNRTPQMELAEKLGITDYPSPAGGCRLTDPHYARRVRDLRRHHELNLDNVRLLGTGRHFRLSDNARLVVGRSHEENLLIEAEVRDCDYLLVARQLPGPTALGRGSFDDSLLRLAAAITARYGQGREQKSVLVDVCRARNGAINIPPAEDERLTEYRL